MKEITGHTKLYCIVADPVFQVKTPQTMNRLLEERGVDGVLVPMHVAPSDLDAFMSGMRGIKNLGGIVVTVPHKTAIVSLCDVLTPAAQTVGAVNVIRRDDDGRMVGDILDGKGFVAGLRSQQIEPQGKTIFLAGAGGAANAIAFALAQAGVARLTVYNRTPAKAEAMIARIAKAYPAVRMDVGTENPAGYELVVNATSLGMQPTDPYPLLVEGLSPDQTVAEIIMKPELTPLLEVAQQKGCRIHYGLPMLQCQIGLMAEFMGIGQ